MNHWKALIPGMCMTMAVGAAAGSVSARAESVSPGHLSEVSQLVVAPNVMDKQRTSAGFGFIRAGKLKKAIAEFDAVISAADRRHLGDPRPRFCARDERDASKITTATGASGTSPVLIDAAVCDAHFGKGYALIDMGRGDLAEAELRRATELAPFDAHYANEYAELYKSRRDWKTSLELFLRAWDVTDKNPAGPDAHLAARALRGIGYNQMMLGNLEAAENSFRQSLEFEPGNKAASIELGHIARQKAIGS